MSIFTANEDVGMAHTLANYIQDIMKIRSPIDQKMNGTMTDPITADHSHNMAD